MRFTVTWLPRALTQLAEIWEGASDRTSVTRAADEIDRLLTESPEAMGESRANGFRIDCVGPLACIFHVSEPDRTARVVRIWRIR